MAMTFGQARNFALRFGKYAKLPIMKRTLDGIATDDEGLLYLDWLRGSLHERCQDWQIETREALDVYLSDASIKSELEEAVRKKRRTGAQQERDELWGR